jgi:amidohydrolase
MDPILRNARQYRELMTELRRHFHMHPEPGWQEHETATLVRSTLERFRIPYTPIPPTGTVAILEGEQPGRTVALRADMDALPIEEKSGQPYISQNKGFSHACGHDAHTAMLLGAAGVLSGMRHRIKGSIKLIFQPAEEIFGGALSIIAGGAMKGVDAVFGMHILGALPSGTAAVSAGAVMAAASHFRLTVTGPGGHGGMPHEGVDAILAASAVIMNLQAIASREIDPLETGVVSVGRVAGGTAYNVLASRVEMEGTTRSFSEKVDAALEEKIGRISRNTARAYGAEASLTYTRSVPPTVNDLPLTALAEKAIDAVCGSEGRRSFSPVTGAEDFAFYLREVPGLFLFLGGGNKKKGLCFVQHHPSFDIDEDALEIGAALYARLALDFLDNETG